MSNEKVMLNGGRFFAVEIIPERIEGVKFMGANIEQQQPKQSTAHLPAVRQLLINQQLLPSQKKFGM